MSIRYRVQTLNYITSQRYEPMYDNNKDNTRVYNDFITHIVCRVLVSVLSVMRIRSILTKF